MKKTAFLLLVMAMLLPGCTGRNANAQKTVQTQTMAPAAPEPAANGTDAMTQTVDVEDGRSVDEGADTASAATDTAAAAKPKTGAAATSRKAPRSKRPR